MVQAIRNGDGALFPAHILTRLNEAGPGCLITLAVPACGGPGLVARCYCPTLRNQPVALSNPYLERTNPFKSPYLGN